MPTESAILSDLLKGTSASPFLNPQRIAPSTVYDLHYRMFVIAACLRLVGKSDGQFRKMSANKLRLLQFVAMRPWLLDTVREWSESRKDRQRSLQSSQSLRRGFLNDAMHDNVIDYLVAAGMLYKQKGQMAEPLANSSMSDIYDKSRKNGLFKIETVAIEELNDIVITNDMLEGW